MENLRNTINLRLLSNKKYYLKWASKQIICYTKYVTMLHKYKVT